MKKLPFMAAMKDYFGLLPEQTLSGFLQEVKKLSPAERIFFTEGLKTVGYEIT